MQNAIIWGFERTEMKCKKWISGFLFKLDSKG